MNHLCLILAFFVGLVCSSKEVIAATKSSRTLAKTSSKMRSTKNSSRSFEKRQNPQQDYLNYLPFGFGQFQQRKAFTGAGFAALQAGSLLFYFDRNQQIKAANRDATEVFNSAPKGQEAELYAFFDQNEAFVKRSQQESQIALLGFFSFYALGVYDALYDPFGLRSSSRKNNKRLSNEVDVSWETHNLGSPSAQGKTISSPEPQRVSLALRPSRGTLQLGLTMETDF